MSIQKGESSAWSRAHCCPQGPSFLKWFPEQCLENQRSDCTEHSGSYSAFLPGPASVSFGCDNVQKGLKPFWGGGNLATRKHSFSQKKLPSSATVSSGSLWCHSPSRKMWHLLYDTGTSAGSGGTCGPCDTGSPILCVQRRARFDTNLSYGVNCKRPYVTHYGFLYFGIPPVQIKLRCFRPKKSSVLTVLWFCPHLSLFS